MDDYVVAFMTIETVRVKAESPREAVNIAKPMVKGSIDGSAYVININTNEEYDI